MNVLIDGHKIYFPTGEFLVFAELYALRGRVIPAQDLLTRLYGHRRSGMPGRNVLGVYISRIRQKLRSTRFEIPKNPPGCTNPHFFLIRKAA